MAQSNDNVSDSRTRNGRNYERFRTLTWIRGSNSSEPRTTALGSYFAAEYEEIIFNALEVIERDVLSGRPIHWNRFRDVMRGMRVTESTVPFCLKFVREILSFLERYQCKETSIISDVFLFMFLTATYEKYFSGGDMYTEMRRSFYIPYGEEGKIDLVWNSAACANLGLLKLQLRFGMEMMAPRFTERYCIRYALDVLKYWPNISANDGIDLEIIHGELNHGKSYEKLLSIINPESWKRLRLVCRVLEIASSMLHYSKCRGHLTECYKLLLDSIPDPYVTSAEVESLLSKCLPYTCSSFILKVAEDFERVCPESAGEKQPRPLQHLSRIQVRQSLRQNRNLPHGVSSLPLPTDLKQYVMLHDDGDYSVVRSMGVMTDELYSNENEWQVFNYVLGPDMDIPEDDDRITSFIKNL